MLAASIKQYFSVLALCLFTFNLSAAMASATSENKPFFSFVKTTSQPHNAEYAHVNGIDIYYEVYGSGSPIVLLHGGLGNTEFWGNQIADFASKHQVIVVDSRGHGRSTRNTDPYSYHLMASDVLAVMDSLSISKASIVGWSDGGNIGIDIAINHPDRLEKVFAFGANFHPSGLKASAENAPSVKAYMEIAAADYRKLSKTPDNLDSFIEQMDKMWANEPNFTKEQLSSITIPIAITAGENEEVIEAGHTKALAAMIPGSKLMFLPDMSHFGMWQKPNDFNNSVLKFLAGN